MSARNSSQTLSYQSPNPFLHLSTSIQPMAVEPNNDKETTICLVKEEVLESAGPNVCKKAIIQLTPEEFNCSKESINSVNVLLDYTSHHLKNHVQLSTPRTCEEAEHSTLYTTHKFRQSHTIDGIDDPRLPKQITEGLTGRENVLEVIFSQPPENKKMG